MGMIVVVTVIMIMVVIAVACLIRRRDMMAMMWIMMMEMKCSQQEEHHNQSEHDTAENPIQIIDPQGDNRMWQHVKDRNPQHQPPDKADEDLHSLVGQANKGGQASSDQRCDHDQNAIYGEDQKC